MAWEFAKMLGSPTSVPPVARYTVGSGGVTKGMPVVMSGSKILTKTGGTDTVQIFGVAMETAAENAVASVILATPMTVFFAPIESTDTPALGTKYGLATTTLAVDDDNTTQTMVKVIDVDNIRSTTVCQVICLGWTA